MSACADTKYKSVFVMSEEKDECIIATEVSAPVWFCGKFLFSKSLLAQPTLTHVVSCRCNEPLTGFLACSMGEFLCSFRCCSNLGGRCPTSRLLLILRRLTDIQSELVLYWKLSAGGGGLWEKKLAG